MSDAIDRIEGRLDRSGDCWLWPGGTNGKGYGVLTVKTGRGREDRTIYVHRLMYERHVGSIPDGMELDHLCEVRHCANPAHLECVTHAENVARAAAKIIACPRGHPYDADNTAITVDGKRRCRACDRDRAYAKRAGSPEYGIRGRRGPNRRWSEDEIALIVQSQTSKDLAEKFGVHPATIQKIRSKHQASLG